MYERTIEDFLHSNVKFSSKLIKQIMNFLTETPKSAQEIARGIHRKYLMVKVCLTQLCVGGRVELADYNDFTFYKKEKNKFLPKEFKNALEIKESSK